MLSEVYYDVQAQLEQESITNNPRAISDSTKGPG